MSGRPRRIMEDRFFEKIEKLNNGCWEWKDSKNKKGYGIFNRNNEGSTYAHRVSYEIYKGAIPDELLVLHKCDNPPCVNPDHLFLGTYADNNHDRDAKGRFKILSGEECGKSKLTDDLVRGIRNEYKHKRGEFVRLAKEYNVTPENISCIINRKTWRHI